MWCPNYMIIWIANNYPKWVDIIRCIVNIQFFLFQFDKTETNLTRSRKQKVLKNTDQDGHPEPYKKNQLTKRKEVGIPQGRKSNNSDYYLRVNNHSTGFKGTVMSILPQRPHMLELLPNNYSSASQTFWCNSLVIVLPQKTG